MTLEINKLTELKTNYIQLKQAIEFPELHIWNTFSEIRNEIDTSANNHLLALDIDENEENDEDCFRKNIVDKWTQMIDRLNDFEKECSKQYRLNSFGYQFVDLVDSIGQQITLLNDQDDEAKYDQLNELVYDIQFKIDKQMFLNVTFVFLDRLECIKQENIRLQKKDENLPDDFENHYKQEVNLFDKLDANLTFGKLIFIKNEYFGKQSIEILRYGKNLAKKINTETIKCKEMREQMETKTTCNEIDELNLDLSKVSLSDHKLSTLSCELFTDLTCLKVIHLSCNQLVTLDENVFSNLKNLSEIWLNHNKLNSLPANLFKGLNYLEKIDLQHNQLARLEPTLFHGLTELKKLWLSDNLLETLDPIQFTGLTKLTHLYLTSNKFNSLDESVFLDQIELRECWLCYNKFKTLPSRLFQTTPNLDKIFLDGNDIEFLPANIFSNLINLTFLFMSYNKLEFIDSSLLKGLQSLTRLSFSYNKICSIDSQCFKDLVNLTEIKLNDNKLKSLDSNIFNENSKLKIVYLNNNQFKYIDKSLFKLRIYW